MTPRTLRPFAVCVVVSSGCTRTFETHQTPGCEAQLLTTTAGPQAVSGIGFSAEEAAAALSFIGDAQVTYDGRIAEATAPLALTLTAFGPSQWWEVVALDTYDPTTHHRSCSIGDTYLTTSATVSWTLEGHLGESRGATLRFRALDDVQEWFSDDERDPAPVARWLKDMVEAEVPCDHQLFETALIAPGVLSADYRSVCDDGGHRFGNVFTATPIR